MATFINVCLYTYTHTHTYIYIYIDVCVCVCVRMRALGRVHACVSDALMILDQTLTNGVQMVGQKAVLTSRMPLNDLVRKAFLSIHLHGIQTLI